ncbi:hypothetical protein PBRA_001347, partial [Plasmodiophora brassicae]
LEGAIRRVVLHNFVTYSDVEFTAGSGLNLVTGPNGSGKSSIVCALCLGLGGDTHSLGRADKTSDFVKRGAETGYIEIELHTPSRSTPRTVIRRVLSKDSTKSAWLINGRPSKKKDVHDITKALNIQVDNLCQFLAQEKVCEFAKLEPKSLLRDTEKAAYDGRLHELHLQLIELRKLEEVSRKELEETTKSLQRMTAQAEALHVEVERLEEQNEMKERIDLLQKYRPWLEFTVLRTHARELQIAHSQALARLKELKKQQEPMVARLESLRGAKADAEAQWKRLQNGNKKLESKYRNAIEHLDTLEVEMASLGEELAAVDKRVLDHKKEVQAVTTKITDLESKLAELPASSDIQARLQELNARKAEQHKALDHLNAKAHAIDAQQRNHNHVGMRMCHTHHTLDERTREKTHLNKELRMLQDEKTQRARKLFSRDGHPSDQAKDCQRFLDWLEKEGRAQCRGKVYGPVGLELQFPVKGAERYVEHLIPYHVLLGFVVENDDDWRLLAQKKSAMRVRVDISTTSSAEFPHRFELPAPLGFLDDAVQGPHAVMQCLKARFQLHETAYTLDPSVRSQKNFMCQSVDDHSRPRRLFFSDSFCSQGFSRYANRAMSFGIDKVQPARSLSGTSDDSQLKNAEESLARIEAELTQLNAEKKVLAGETVPINKVMKEINSEMGQLTGYEKSRKVWKRMLAQYRQSLDDLSQIEDVEVEKERIRKRILDKNEKRVKGVETAKALVREIISLHDQGNAAGPAAAQAAEVLRVTQLGFREANRQYAEAESDAEAAKQELRAAASRAAKAKEKAESIAPRAEYEERFDVEWIPKDDLRAINELIMNLQAQVDSVVGDDSVRQRYKQLLKDIEHMKGKQSACAEKHDEEVEQIDLLRAQWRPALVDVTKKINERYKGYFQKFDCDGQVELAEAPNEADYGMNVLVKFREESGLQQLRQSRQSGGEKSVATMLYLLALQAVTKCPFRVVDEINQGMDPKNERNIFNQIVECSAGRGTPQIFCITPKLLPNLHFTDSITTIAVFNGAWNLPQPEFDLPGIVARHAA